jgi:HEAT repeat protein
MIKREAPRHVFSLRLPFFYFVLIFCTAVFAAFPVHAQEFARYSEMIRSGNVEEKREALFQIRNLRRPEASRLAVPALTDSNEMVRATAAASVVFLPPAEAAYALIPLLGDKNEFVRREAAYALGRVGDPAAAARLVQVLGHDKSLVVRAAAAVGLGGIGEVAAVEPLANILKTPPKEEQEFLRRSAARAIGQTAQFIQTGVSRAVTPQNFLPERYKRFREKRHAELISEFPEFKSTAMTLIQVIEYPSESDDTRREAAYSLGAIGDPLAVPILEKHITDEDRYLAEICREALLKIKTPAANLPSQDFF